MSQLAVLAVRLRGAEKLFDAFVVGVDSFESLGAGTEKREQAAHVSEYDCRGNDKAEYLR